MIAPLVDPYDQCARQDSNLRHVASKATALSPELRARPADRTSPPGSGTFDLGEHGHLGWGCTPGGAGRWGGVARRWRLHTTDGPYQRGVACRADDRSAGRLRGRSYASDVRRVCVRRELGCPRRRHGARHRSPSGRAPTGEAAAEPGWSQGRGVIPACVPRRPWSRGSSHGRPADCARGTRRALIPGQAARCARGQCLCPPRSLRLSAGSCG